MSNTVIFGVLLLSLASLPVLYFFNSKIISVEKEMHAFLAFISSIFAVVIVAIILFSRFFRNVDPMMYALCAFCWMAVSSLCSALQMDGFIGNKFTSFLLKREPYLKTGYGILSSYWDGTVHLALCLVIILQYTRRKSHRELSLFLCGSMVNSGLVFAYGIFCGPYDVTLMSLCRLAYIVVPANAAVYYLHNKPVQARTFLQFPSVWRRPVDCFFMLFFKVAGAVALFRGMAVLGSNMGLMKDYVKMVEPYLKDPSTFPKFQMIIYDFLFVAYYAFVMYGLMYPGQHWMTDWSLIHAGAAAQAQFCHIGGALHRLSPKAMKPPTSGQAAVENWSINLLLFIVPLLFAFWCQRDPEKNGRSFTADLAHPIETKVVRRTTKVSLKSD